MDDLDLSTVIQTGGWSVISCFAIFLKGKIDKGYQYMGMQR